MRRMTLWAARSPIVMAAAIAAAGGSDDAEDIAAGVFWYVKNKVAFVEDETVRSLCGLDDGRELQDFLISPDELLSMPRPIGDCDDFSMLAASLLAVLDVPSRFVIVAADSAAPDQFSHVYVEALMPSGRVVPLDCSHGPFPGWQGKDFFRQERFDVYSPSKGGGLNGLGLATSGGIDWGSIIGTAVNTTADIFRGRYGQPPPGTYISQGPGGTTVYRPGDGGGSALPPVFTGTVGSSLSPNTLMLIGGVGLVLLLVMAAQKK